VNLNYNHFWFRVSGGEGIFPCPIEISKLLDKWDLAYHPLPIEPNKPKM